MKSKTYEEFVEKFKPKKTTDDCYTPPLVYEAVKDWACAEYDIDPENIVRPFWPGGDYEKFDTPKEAEQAHAADEARKAKEAEDYWRAWWASEKSKKRWPRDENGKLIKNPDGTFKKK